MSTITYSTQLTVLSCGECHVPFAMPKNLYNSVYQSGAWFWCPNGHKIHFYEDENTRLKAELDQVKADREWQRRQRVQADERAAHERRSAIAYKGHLTRVRKRIAHGVCPVPGCKRSGFERVMAHISSQHPDWLAEHPEVVEGPSG